MASVELIHIAEASAVAAIPSAAGPRALLESGLVDRLAADEGDVRVTQLSLDDGERSNPVADSFKVCDLVARRVRDAIASGRMAVVLSGSCHAGLGSVAGLPSGRRGVLWLDTHGDFNTPDTTTSGLLDGTVLATITGRCWAAMAAAVHQFEPVGDSDVLMIGVRNLDGGEDALLAESRVGRISSEEVRTGAAGPRLSGLAGQVDHACVHLDADILDPAAGRGNAWAAPGGLSASELRDLAARIGQLTPVRVLTVASYDPGTDQDGRARAAILDAIAALVAAARR